MKILMSLRDPYPPRRADVKSLFGKYLSQRGLSTDLLAQTAPDGGDADTGWPAGRATVLAHAPGASRVMRLLRASRFFFLGLFRCGREADAIQVRDQVFLSLAGLAAARLRGIRFFYWMSFPFPEGDLEIVRTQSLAGRPLRSGITYCRGLLGYRLLYGFVARRADHVFVQSDRMLELMVERGVPRARMTAVPMGVDMARVGAAAHLPVSDHRLHGRRTLIYIGALDRVRRIDFLLEVLARVSLDIPKVALVLAGGASEPEDVEWLKKEAGRLGIANSVVWLGWLSTEEAWRYVKSAEIGLSAIPPGPLYDVSSPTKALEYMALGIPVVASRIPDQEKVLTESQAGLTTGYDVHAFAEAVTQLLLDPQRAQRMGMRGPEYIARERDYQVLAERLAVVYRGLLAAPVVTPAPGAGAQRT
ncbi:MAG TPA: glycosyltransferase family 4 protein [Burkholderiales bacterium]|jgi:glycosyltransferase involved in cell wall biosynthesis